MIEKEIIVQNRAGLHTRPAASLVKLTSKFKSEISLIRDGFVINGKSIIGVMTLAAEMGCKLQVIADGEDEELAIQEISQLFDSKFGEI